MIAGPYRTLEETGEPGLSDLRRALRRVFRESAGDLRFTGWQRLKSRVYRLRFTGESGERSVVVKRLGPLEARRNELVESRWLPAVGLAEGGPGLLGTSAPARGPWIWHVYQDHGVQSLEGRESEPECVAAAIRLIAQIHSRFASHRLLAQCRPYGAFDISYFSTNVRDALRSLQLLRPPRITLAAEHAALRDRLLARLTRLLGDEPRRALALAEFGGPETLLHGDLWTSNVFVLGPPHDLRARLTDWDRSGVGPMIYDLSTFLLRFPAEQRGWILDLYSRSLENRAWRPPALRQLNLLCETAELSRYANRVIWPALAITPQIGAWAFEELAEVERWFEALEPVVPRPSRLAMVRRASRVSFPSRRAARPRRVRQAAGGGS